jgi:CheY-like chemotaxis protein
MGGRLVVESEVGQGSEFSFQLRLPIVEAAPVPAVPAASLDLIVIDDQTEYMHVLRRQLSYWGFDPQLYADWQEAAQALQARRAMRSPALPFDGDGAAAKNRVLLVAAELLGAHRQEAVNICVSAGIRQVIVLAPIHDPNEARYLALPMLHGIVKRPWRPSRLLDELQSTLAPERVRPVTQRLTKSQLLSGPRAKVVSPDGERDHQHTQPVPGGDQEAAPRVLLVEDSPVNQKIASIMLKKLGLTVDLADNGRQALRCLEGSSYDIVFMDCQMPEMDGFEATRAVRAGGHGNEAVPIIALTANAMMGDRDRCVSAGMSDYLSKPVTQERMQAMVDNWLGQTHG